MHTRACSGWSVPTRAPPYTHACQHKHAPAWRRVFWLQTKQSSPHPMRLEMVRCSWAWSSSCLSVQRRTVLLDRSQLLVARVQPAPAWAIVRKPAGPGTPVGSRGPSRTASSSWGSWRARGPGKCREGGKTRGRKGEGLCRFSHALGRYNGALDLTNVHRWAS